MRHPLLACLLFAGCTPSAGPRSAPADGAVPVDAPADDAPDADAPSDASPTECSGYEPCGIHPVETPAGYTLEPSVNVELYGATSSCTDWADCGMWNTHYTSNYVDTNGQPVDPYFNRMGSPFPWVNSRYIVDVSPKKIHYAKLHVLAPGEMYRYSDDTLEMRIDRSTGAATCFQRSASSMASAGLRSLGGTGNRGSVTWNISVLPGDMGDSGNISSCTGDGFSTRAVTADPVTAATPNASGKFTFCLLREGHDYYINFRSAGTFLNGDCATDVCTMGGLFLSNFTSASGPESPVVEVPCP
jgi:hypothetical protein